MTHAQLTANTNYQRALTRADAQGIKVLEHQNCPGIFNYFKVLSSDGVMVYIVDVVGAHLVCNCPAAADGNYCKHRAVVTRCLMEEAAAALGEIYGAFDNLTSTEEDSDRTAYDDAQEARCLSNMEEYVTDMAC